MQADELLPAVTTRYSEMQSLKTAPMWLYIAMPWSPQIPHWLNPKESTVPFAIFMAFYLIWYYLLNHYYVRRFGKIKTRAFPFFSKNDVKTQRIFLLVCVVSLILYENLKHIPPHMGIYLLLLSCCVILGTGFTVPNLSVRLWYYRIIGTLVLLSLLPVIFRQLPGHDFFTRYDFAICGLAMVLVALLDHFLLLHTFRRIARMNYAQ